MKNHREAQVTETIRKGRGVRIVGPKTLPKKSKEDASVSHAIQPESRFHPYYEAGKVYAFTVGLCVSDQQADGKQYTRYIVKDKRDEKHNYYCDCTRFKYNQEIFLRVKEISNWELQFEQSVIERLDEIFLKGEEYEFEVISCKNKRCIVCDVQIGKNHLLIVDDGLHYERGEILKLEVQGYDDKGDLLLVDRNPPAPIEPCVNSLQIMAEAMEKSPKSVPPQAFPKQNSLLSDRPAPNLSDTPKVTPSIAIPREDKRILVEDLGHKLPENAEKRVLRSPESKPVYTQSIPQPQPDQQPVSQPMPQTKPAPTPQPKTQTKPDPDSQPKPQSDPKPQPIPQSEPEPQPEQEPAWQPEPPPESWTEHESRRASVLQVFMAWMNGVTGMEKTEDYTVCSGHAEVVDTAELPGYQQQKMCEDEAKEAHTQFKPWYIRVWQFINRYFSRN